MELLFFLMYCTQCKSLPGTGADKGKLAKCKPHWVFFLCQNTSQKIEGFTHRWLFISWYFSWDLTQETDKKHRCFGKYMWASIMLWS